MPIKYKVLSKNSMIHPMKQKFALNSSLQAAGKSPIKKQLQKKRKRKKNIQKSPME
jgi:hypothetical protein